MKVMKTFTPLLILFLTAGLVTAQPELNNDIFYTPGDYVIGFDVVGETVEDGPDGANQIWDYSHFESAAVSEIWSGSVVSPSETYDFGMFTEADIALVLNNGTVRYWSNTNSLVSLGHGGNQEILDLDIPATWMTYPFTFGSSQSDQASGTLFSTCRDYDWSASSEIEGVGYGTLILPGGTYENVLKIRRITFSTKSNDEIGLERTNNVVEHFWFQPGTHGPLLYMRTWSNDGCPGTSQGEEIVYTVPNTTTQIDVGESTTLRLSAFPNPTRDEVHLSLSSNDTSDLRIWISDMMGHELISVDTQSSTRNELFRTVDVSQLSGGVYLINVHINDKRHTEKLIIQ